MRRMTREQDIQHGVLEFLRRQFPGAVVEKMHIGPVQVGNGQRVPNPLEGWPDLFMLLPPNGRYVGFECKRPGQKVKDGSAQAKAHERIARTGAQVFVVTSIEDTQQALAAMDLPF